jgi:hypothetical protein
MEELCQGVVNLRLSIFAKALFTLSINPFSIAFGLRHATGTHHDLHLDTSSSIVAIKSRCCSYSRPACIPAKGLFASLDPVRHGALDL